MLIRINAFKKKMDKKENKIENCTLNPLECKDKDLSILAPRLAMVDFTVTSVGSLQLVSKYFTK